VALSIKLTVPLLLLPLWLALVRPSALRNWGCIAAGALLLFSLTCRVQIGVRLMLPLVVLAIVGLAGAAGNVLRSSAPSLGPVRRRLASMLLVLGIAWAGLSAVLVWPEGLCYVNEAWGGTEEGYRRLSDSNYDWGQGLKELMRWKEEHGIAEMDVWYFGSDPAILRPPLHFVALHAPPPGENVTDMIAQLHGHWLAVSTTLLYGMPFDTDAYRQTVAFLRSHRPVARTSTFFIYDFTEPPVVASP
jgi:hypothetical protein